MIIQTIYRFSFVFVIVASLIGCNSYKKITEKQCEDKVKLTEELARLRYQTASVETVYKEHKEIIERKGSTVYDTIFINNESIHNFYRVDPTGQTALRVEYDSLLKRYRIACETLSKYDTIKLNSIERTVNKFYDESKKAKEEPIKETNYWYIWLILGVLFSCGSYVLYNKYVKTRL